MPLKQCIYICYQLCNPGSSILAQCAWCVASGSVVGLFKSTCKGTANDSDVVVEGNIADCLMAGFTFGVFLLGFSACRNQVFNHEFCQSLHFPVSVD